MNVMASTCSGVAMPMYLKRDRSDTNSVYTEPTQGMIRRVPLSSWGFNPKIAELYKGIVFYEVDLEK